MSTNVGHIQGRISLDRADWRRGFQEARSDMRDFGRDAQTAGRDWQQIGQKMQDVGGTLTRSITLPAAAMGAGMLKAAGDAQTAATRMGVTFGDQFGDMNEYLVELQNLAPAAMSELQNSASNAMGALITLGVEQERSNEMTKEALEVAANLSAHMDVSFSDALSRIQAGYAGNTQSLRDMAYNINQAEIETRALEMGLVAQGEAVNGAARAQAVHNIVMEQSVSIMDAAERQAGTFNYELRQLWASVQDTGAAFGEIMLPMATQFVTFASIIIERIGDMDTALQTFVLGMGGIAAAAGPALLAIGKLIAMGPALSAGFAFMAGPGAPLILGAIALGAALYTVANNWEHFEGRLNSLRAPLDQTHDLMDRIVKLSPIDIEINVDDDGPGRLERTLNTLEQMVALGFDVATGPLRFHAAQLEAILSGGESGGMAQFWRETGESARDFYQVIRDGEVAVSAEAEAMARNMAVSEGLMSIREEQGEAERNYQRELRGTAQEMRNLEEDIAETARELDNFSDQHDTAATASETLRTEIERTGDPTGELTALLQGLEIIERDLEGQLRDTNVELAQQQAEALGAGDAVIDMRNAIEAGSGREGAFSNVASDIDVMADALEGASEQVTHLARQYDTLHGAIDEVSERLSHWDSMLSDTEDAVEFLREEIERTGDPTGELGEKLEQAEWGIERFEGGVRDLRGELVDSQLDMIEYHRLHDDLARALDDGVISQDEYETALRELNDQFDQMNADPLKDTLDGAAGFVDELVGGLRDLMVELGLLEEQRPEVTISVEDQDAAQAFAQNQDRADSLDGRMVTTIAEVDTEQPDAEVPRLRATYDGIPTTVETNSNLDNSQPDTEVPRLRLMYDGIPDETNTISYADVAPAETDIGLLHGIIAEVPKSFTITPDVNMAPFREAMQSVRDMMPFSPAKEGPLRDEPNWGWLFEGLAFEAGQATEETAAHIQELAKRIRGAWGGPDSSAIAGAIMTGLEDDLSRMPEMVGHITPDVLAEFAIMRAGIQNELQLAQIMGDSERVSELESELQKIQQIAIAWADETGIGMGEALGKLFDADRAIDDMAEFFEQLERELAEWEQKLGNREALQSGDMYRDIKDAIAELDADIAFAQEHGAPQHVLDALQADREIAVQELHEAAEAYRKAIDDGMALSPGDIEAADVFGPLFDDFDNIVSGETERKLEAAIDELQDKIKVGMATPGVPEHMIEQWEAELASKQAQLEQVGEIIGSAVAAGVIQETEPMTDEMVAGLAAAGVDGGRATAQAIVDGLESGRLDLAQAAELVPDTMISELQSMLAGFDEEMQQALISGSDPTEALRNYDQIKAILDEMGVSAEAIGNVNLDDLVRERNQRREVSLMDLETGETKFHTLAGDQTVEELLDDLFRAHGERFVPDLSRLREEVDVDWSAAGHAALGGPSEDSEIAELARIFLADQVNETINELGNVNVDPMHNLIQDINGLNAPDMESFASSIERISEAVSGFAGGEALALNGARELHLHNEMGGEPIETLIVDLLNGEMRKR